MNFGDFLNINLILSASTPPNHLVVNGLLGMSHSFMMSPLDIENDQTFGKIGQFNNFLSLSKISLILSLSTPPNHLVVNGLLGEHLC